QGSDLFATAASVDSVRVDSDGASDQVLAAGNITIQNIAAAPASAHTILNGVVRSSGAGTVSISAKQTIEMSSTLGSVGGPITLTQPVLLTGTTLVTAGAGNVTFSGTVNGGFGLTVNSAGTTTFGGAVGNNDALASLTTDAAGSTAINGGSVTTTGNQTYHDSVTLDAVGNSTTLTGVNISFDSTLRSTTDGEEALIVNASGVTTFGGAVGDGGKR